MSASSAKREVRPTAMLVLFAALVLVLMLPAILMMLAQIAADEWGL